MTVITKSILYRGNKIYRGKKGWIYKRKLGRKKAFKNLIDAKNYIDKVKE